MSVEPRSITASAPTTSQSEALRRIAIDLIATSRTRAVRVALFAQMVQRVGTTATALPATPEQCITELEQQVQIMTRACQVIRGTDPDTVIPESHLRWLKHHADASPDIHDVLDTIERLSRDVLNSARGTLAGKPEEAEKLDTALQAHFKFGRGAFYAAVTRFCDALWLSLDDARDSDLERSQQVSKAVTEALSRLDKIGRHVRLVSINASVEASRAGDAGKGLAVIAVEFKSLSEEIQKLAASAKHEIDSLL